MAISVIGSVATTSAADANTTRSLPSYTLTAGSFVLVCVGYRGNSNLDSGGTLTSVTDSLGNTYTLATPTGANNDYTKVRYAYCTSVATGGSATITANFGPGPTAVSIGYGCEMWAREYSGIHATPIVACVQSAGSAASHTSGTAVTTASEEHVLVAGTIVFLLGAANADYSGWSNSFTEVNDPTTGPTGFAVATRIVTGAGSWSTDATCSSANEHHTSLIAIRGAADAGGGVTGTINRTIAGPTLAATGTPVVTGTVARTIAAPTLAASGSPIIVGTIARTIGGPTAVASGSPIIPGTISRTISGPTLVSSGSPVIVGTVSRTIDGPTLVATGEPGGGIIGIIDVTIGQPTLVATGTPVIPGTVTATIPGPTSDITGFAGSGNGFNTGNRRALLNPNARRVRSRVVRPRMRGR